VRATDIQGAQIDKELPLRAELFSALQMEQHGRILANAHKLSTGSARDQLLPRLADNENVIINVCNQLTEAIKAGRQVTPAAEWLLDNFYLVEEQIHTAKRHLPKDYSKELPRLLRGASAGRPRVYDIALETIAHGDGRVDPESLSLFVAAYQQVTPLKLGELWAIPIMLRLALIENLRRVAVRLSTTRTNRNLANAWADAMAQAAEKDPSTLILLVADMARSNPPMDSSFVAELVRRLQWQSPTLMLPLTWLSQRLAESGQTIEHLVHFESQQQAADQVSISNSIGSLRFLSAMDWREFVESMSAVDHALRKDPANVYARMDFATRDHYRHVVEKIARYSRLSEPEVAQAAILLANTSATRVGIADRSAHVGHYLIGNGLPELERSAAFRLPVREAVQRAGKSAPLGVYLSSILLFTLAATGAIAAKVYADGVNAWLLALVITLALVATSQLALSLVNWLATLITMPRPLPRMDFSHGIPHESRTIVVVPTMLLSQQNIDSLIETLEVRFLANRDDNLHFCLLTDFGDAATETLPNDEALLEHAKRNIDELNHKYHPIQADNFLLLHRPRRWNAQEKIWMGYERKRGKLADLNAFLRGGAVDAFSLIVGNIDRLSLVRYVITLDTDTELPRDAARQFVATMAHPLNRPRYDENRQRVCEGYGILQPRVAVSLPGADASRYELLCGGEAGIDPYTRTVSDVYQDVFGEGSFIGKGIYDIDAFEQALNARMPENRILSHDLLEGCYARSGLLSDAQLYERYPSRYSDDVNRRHRWIRGDWQIASWLLPKVPGPRDESTGKIVRHRNPLSALSRWKVFDNLRRSVVPFALTALLLIGWIALPSPWFWTAVVLGILFIPLGCAFIRDLAGWPADVLLQQHFSALLRSTTQHFVHASLTLIFLPYEAWSNLDAIMRTQWRVLISRRKLLEWKPSSEVNSQSGNALNSYQSMWIAPAIALATAAWLIANNPFALEAAAPILLIWLVSPLIAYWISKPIPRRAAHLSNEQTLFLKSLSRKTWLFFETYVGPEDNWLPPDNVQEHPIAVVAHRTSPTNIGLSLLANLVAHDFGYIPAGKLIKRSQNTFQSMAALERYQGHFYNWYNTQTLQPLHPMYVSTVDSGNLAGHLLTLRAGLTGLSDTPILGSHIFFGIRDTFQILRATAGGALPEKLSQFEKDLDSSCQSAPHTLLGAHDCLQRLNHYATSFAAGLDAVPDTPLIGWARALTNQCDAAFNEIRFLAPWLQTPSPSKWIAEFPALGEILTLRQVAQIHAALAPAFEQQLAGIADPEKAEQISALHELVAAGSRRAAERMLQIDQLALQAGEFARMEYGFLYDRTTHLLAIGYNVTERRRDASFYDLLASEARLATFVAIALGQLPQESWFALGRQLTIAGSEPILLSWSGSMFEYLMPLLVMPTFENTLLDQTYHSAVERQIEYGAQRGVQWGMSESGYNTFDAGLNYQYRAFGVPGLGFKRGLGDDLVIAPYASMMALMVAPEAACLNLQQLSSQGFEGEFGFYEAIDYTPSRLPRGQNSAVIRSFMAHHQGMGLLSLAYLLLDRPLQKRFESDPLFQATMSLLYERVPKASATYSNTTELADIRTASTEQGMQMRVLQRPDPRVPEVQLLSNGRYHVMVTSAGGSYSRWNDMAITRWREDSTRDNWGTFCYVRDMESGRFWSTAFQPTLVQPQSQSYEVIFSEGRAEFRRNDNNFEMHTEIVVSPEDDIELRRTRIVNRSRVRKTIEITSYAEVVLAPAIADSMHPAFSNLFVQTEIIPGRRAILCTRRPRSINEKTPWMFHLMALHGADVGDVSYETDRMQFIGRGNTVTAPQAMRDSAPLAGHQGSVLDPIVAIRYQITLEAEQAATIDMVTGIGESRDICLGLIEKYQDRHLADRVVELSWTHSQVLLRQLNASEADAQLYGRLANSVIYANPLLRADTSILIRNQRGQSGLWGYAISGDLPIVLVQIKSQQNIELVRQMVQAHAYWRSKGLAVDLVIWNEDHAGYRQVLQEQIMGLISSVTGTHAVERPGGIFVRLIDQISNEDHILFQSVARIILSDGRGTLAEQINRRDLMEIRIPKLIPTVSVPAITARNDKALPKQDLILANAMGGFTPDGREYVITTAAYFFNDSAWFYLFSILLFGSVISESGQAYTWGENAHEFRLTPWANDAVCDTGGEVFYLRDEESGRYWCPTPLPRCSGDRSDYVTRHGFGYSIFEHTENGIASELTVYVALDASVKYSVLRIRNDSDTVRKLSATGYVEWVLGDLRSKSTMHVITETDPSTGALFARNPYNTEFVGRTAFFDVDATLHTITCDRNEFIGRNRSLQNPAAMERTRLSGKVGAGLDPCAAMQVQFELVQGQQREIVFMLGMAGSRRTDVGQMVQRCRGRATAQAALNAVHAYWDRTLGTLQIETPDPSLNILANGWLLYQTIACRLWARSGYYQSGGAFGFRDQLQDTMALVHIQPQLMREQLLLCAAHQFIEGDVQHWWHPPTDRGVRTHCSDDYLWLPLAVHRYVTGSGDAGVLDETVHFIEGRALNHGEDSYYDLPSRSAEGATLYQHCVRAIEKGLKFGVHGLPLIGSCDWNDGMDKVGAEGKGESIWLGFFLYEVLMRFAKVAMLRDDAGFAGRCHAEAAQLRLNIEKNGWDGEWYRRAYFDDGTPLGSAQNAECQIDSISQSWSVLSDAGDPQRSRMAMQAVDRRLVRRDDALIQLLDPPFDKSDQNPGYIRGYVPGVRENGGQYTHAAIWTAMAFAKLGDNRRAWELLQMINPVNHGKTAKGIARYKVEPYVIAADVYAVSPHVGRGGWTWYTGSSGWMYRLIIESLLGFTLEGDKLTITPCVPNDWPAYRLHYRYRDTMYRITVTQDTGDDAAGTVKIDGVLQKDRVVLLVDDKEEHAVEIVVPVRAELPHV